MPGRLRYMLLGAVACGSVRPSTHPVQENHGDLRDMKAIAGSFDGYDVIAPCNEVGLVGIRGQGPVHLPTAKPMRPDASPQVSEEFVGLRARIEAAVQPYAVAVGYGLGCRAESNEFSLRIFVRFYRDVDPVIARLGALLKQEQRGEEYVVLLVTSW